MLKPILAADGPRITIVTLDNHLASAVDRARRTLTAEIPGLQLDFHASSDWNDPKALDACLASINQADIIVASMLFQEEHAQMVVPAIRARRLSCAAVVGCMSAPDVVKLTRLGSFNLDGTTKGKFDFLKKLRGKPKETGGAAQLAMLKRLPKILRFIPGGAQDVRAYFLTLQYWLAGSDENVVNLVRFLVNRYGRRRSCAMARRAEGRGAGRISRRRRLSSAHARPRQRERRQAAQGAQRQSDGRPSFDARVHPGRQFGALRCGDRRVGRRAAFR